MLKKNKINFIPFIADIVLLLVIFFISVIILQQIKLQHSEDIFNIPANTYFESMEYELTNINKAKLIKFLFKDEYFKNLYEKFQNNTLKEIRITGFADQTQPSQDILQYKRWKTNRELSFLRANTVCNLLIEIAIDSMKASNDEINKLKGKLLPAGYGEFKQWNKYDIEVDSTWYELMNKIKYNYKAKKDSIWIYNKNIEDFNEWKNKKNRRIEIKTIYNK